MSFFFFFSSRRRHTRFDCDWSSDVCSSDLLGVLAARQERRADALAFDRTLQAMSPRYLYGRHTMWRARIQAVLGERDTAVGLVQEAFAQGYPRGGVMHLFPSLRSLRDYPSYQELLTPKE